MKKNLLKMLVVAGMITSSISTTVFASTVNTNNIVENKIEQTQESYTLDSELKAYILSLKGINNDEKQKLIEAEKIVQPIYKQIDSLIDDANKAGKNTEKQIDELNNKIYEIQSEDNEIMERVYKYEEAKLIDNMDEDSYNIDMIEYIKSLPILTDSEKDKLIDTHKKLAPYYEQLDSLYKKLNKIQKPIIDKIDKLYDKVDEGYKDVAYIWNKVEY
ncbi:hypothetical protein ACQPUS_10320 [Clostridium butyricum]|jgi:chromosome segregation ATPase|uniref:Uncharacterized protein n=1 Tax=Clostridium butyricum TaxID=1492 RepID=A0A3R9EPZ3_CLOBU|nr:membrane protein [Clostridium butyricum]ALR90773.1 hypothetical protein ATN24_20280 [Clostridium butyricum]ALS19010.1 hypothetical protein ATD26_19225 [Clostridium butyricum]ANF16197.1 hypothetical protein AZ909_19260 [Clostridium butyricum]AOR96107.1 hypothetical protein BBB49_18730 [Clostridium butyricum]MCI3010356.1 hypothetical protein [Clostridium butyricum]